MKPDNIVVDMSGPDPRVRLIDLDPDYVRDVSMDIDSPASNELRAKQQNIVKPRGDFPIESQIFYEHLRNGDGIKEHENFARPTLFDAM